ncbi:hypothetical protein TNCV_2955241 [Trichonephila clavipes]|nr:hypothetical protein TNCV_2955241 [Trichonephila clavipes]
MTWCISSSMKRNCRPIAPLKDAHIWEEESRYTMGPVGLNLAQVVKVCMTTKHASPNENTATSIPVPFNDVRGMIAASLFSR